MSEKATIQHSPGSDESHPDQVIEGLEQELWSKKLYDPEVLEDLQAQRASLRVWSGPVLAKTGAIILVTGLLSVFVHPLFIVPGAAAMCVVYVSARMSCSNARRSMDLLIGPPSEAFPQIAVNKIIMEGCERSPFIDRYMKAIQKSGRGWGRVTGFENRIFCLILGQLDRKERQAADE